MPLEDVLPVSISLEPPCAAPRSQTEHAMKDRYFALVVRIPHHQAQQSLGSVVDASTVLGNLVREHGAEFLPEGSRIIRSIEITEEFAIKTWQ